MINDNNHTVVLQVILCIIVRLLSHEPPCDLYCIQSMLCKTDFKMEVLQSSQVNSAQWQLFGSCEVLTQTEVRLEGVEVEFDPKRSDAL